ncbi:hypothetical protein [Wolbachia endosymbiont of Drosophila seguyi]|nr:hypothetical protein [Wolbachia endosymbiont of Drosophila seguyi]
MHYLQLSFLDPSSLGTAVIKELVSATFMTPSGRPKSQCSYSYGMNRGMT